MVLVVVQHSRILVWRMLAAGIGVWERAWLRLLESLSFDPLACDHALSRNHKRNR